jgi:aminomethyltransferase
MGYVAKSHAAPGSRIMLMVRGKPLPATVVAMPFVTQNYHRG